MDKKDSKRVFMEKKRFSWIKKIFTKKKKDSHR